jgi:hypothetical protein
MNTVNAKPKPSRKQRVQELYNQAGAEEAFTFGRRLQLKPSTLHSWIGSGAVRRQRRRPPAFATAPRSGKLEAQKTTEPAPTTEVQAEVRP